MADYTTINQADFDSFVEQLREWFSQLRENYSNFVNKTPFTNIPGDFSASGSNPNGYSFQDWFMNLLGGSGYQADLNREFNSAEAAKQRDWQSSENALARDFQLMMSNTAYQRSMADMSAAGLNPILAYSQGGAANSAFSPASSATASHQGIAGSDLGSLAGGLGSLAEGIAGILQLFLSKKVGAIGFGR